MAYQGFQKVQQSIESKEGYSSKRAGAVAAAIGRRKYGKKQMAAMAAEGRRRSAKSGR